MISFSKRFAAIGISLAVIVFAVWYTWANVGASPAPPNSRVFLDAQTGDRFDITLTEGMGSFPLINPRTEERTLWPAEMCTSPKCKRIGGTPVTLNSYLGKSGQTLCPVCGAEVHLHNRSRSGATER